MSDIRYWYEDLTPGRVFRHGDRKVTAEEIIRFAQEFDPQPFHLSEEAGKASILGGLSASGWHTCSMTMRMYYDNILRWSSSEGAPGIDTIEWRKPVLAGDTLSGETKVIEARALNSRPGIGIVRLHHTIINQNGETVMFMDNPGMFRMRLGADA
ncbi:MaoC family dehydratase [Rhizobium sp. KVB221]|uniref:MaoC family dehydratase n=1 Tax=Rhizobium setariae TaxID=2801340 RepID=A0A936YSR6_9HYPH|nr:MaoC family dehydratase [Rhizobium setariae]MBL0371997.1 MaoC family dehydratase [Rhizobium setariae]